jgi:hypothetical protein
MHDVSKPRSVGLAEGAATLSAIRAAVRSDNLNITNPYSANVWQLSGGRKTVRFSCELACPVRNVSDAIRDLTVLTDTRVP